MVGREDDAAADDAAADAQLHTLVAELQLSVCADMDLRVVAKEPARRSYLAYCLLRLNE